MHPADKPKCLKTRQQSARSCFSNCNLAISFSRTLGDAFKRKRPAENRSRQPGTLCPKAPGFALRNFEEIPVIMLFSIDTKNVQGGPGASRFFLLPFAFLI
jgi:hypothetical protein